MTDKKYTCFVCHGLVTAMNEVAKAAVATGLGSWSICFNVTC